jgi:methylation protein EvaC
MNIKFLNLGMQPLANEYPSFVTKKQKKYNLNICFNTKNKVVSISKRMRSEKMFNQKYPYRSSMSKTMKDSFKKLSRDIIKRFNPNLTLEIGSNDGALITNLNKKRVIGIEPCSNLAAITKKKGFMTYDEYWNFNLAKKLKKKHGLIDLIYSANTLTHISNLDEVFKSVNYLLNKNGILIIEDPSLLECIKNNAYDQFYNEHVYVFSALALRNILKKFNMDIFDIQKLKTHGGSLRYFIKKKQNNKIKISNKVFKQFIAEKRFGLEKLSTYKKFALNVKSSKKNLLKIFEKLKEKNKSVVGYGATAKAVTILNYCKIDNKFIKFFLDTTPEKQNKLLPGTNIRIYKYSKKKLSKENFIFLGAWNFKNEIFKKEKNFIKDGGKFISHIPFPRIL